MANLTFVISGTLDSLEREEAEHLIKSHGGRVTGSVSKKTDYLLADEDIGGRKSQKAKELGVKFITEDGLFEMIRKTKPKAAATSSQAPRPSEPAQPQKAAEVIKPIIPKTDDVRNVKGKIANGTSSSVGNEKSIASGTESWPYKHRPQSINDIIGNQSIVKQVQDWLVQWEKHHGNAVKGKKGSSSTSQKKAVLLSGPPGIGKTTTARLVCDLLGYVALEVNASDTRGKSDSNVKNGIGGKTSNTIKEMISNRSLGFGSKSERKAVLIMDEVDGMSGGDRGGVADLILSIKSSHIPIICICNDKYSQKLKSLINYCLPLPFRKPTKQQMAKRLQQIAKSEGLEVDDLALEELSERVNGDMRMALNQLQYMSLRSRSLKYSDVRTRLMASAKDEDVTPFSAVDKLLGFEGGRLRMDERIDAAMSDMDLVPLLVQENYLNYCGPGGRDDSGTARMDAIARTALSIAEGDIVNVQIHRFRQWQHAQMGAFMSSVIPAAYIHGRREVLVQGERNFNRFGGWLGKNSTFGKKTRLLEDVHVHMLASRICEPTREAVRLDYLPLLSMHLTQPLHTLPKDEAVQQVVDLLEEYSLDQEDMDTIVSMSTLKGGEGLLEGVPGATKTALTKTYKQRLSDRRVRSADLLPVMSLPGTKKAAKKPARMNFMAAEDEESLEALEDAIDDVNEDNDGEDEDEKGADEKSLALLTQSRPGMTVTLDPKSKPGAGRGRGRGTTKASQAKTPTSSKKSQEQKATSAAKRKK